MNNVVEHNDLCSSCNYKSLCTKRKNLKRPIWFCEEYDDFLPQQKKKIFNSKYPYTKSSLSNSKVGSIKYKGICSNCKICDKCLYPKSENGIWHCEEYQ